ncbi:hypothetical protein HYW35_03385 [Candidatus Saccharibacteria bacterium]|nr:hypothetical protein [Candidatus Saccharibacteria bacterium]
MKLWRHKNLTEKASLSSDALVKRNLAIIAVLAGLFAITYYFLIYNPQTKYTYSNLGSYHLEGSITGSGVVFLKPSSFKDYKKANDQIALRQESVNSKNNQVSAAFLSAASTSEATAYTDIELLALKANFAFPDKNYSLVAGPIESFVKNWLPSDWQVSLEKAKPFTNKTIKDNAWQFAISTKDPSSKAGTYKGKAIYAIHNNNFYYFFIATAEKNWQDNQKTWQQIIDGLQINQ